jgi:hypothetical protein
MNVEVEMVFLGNKTGYPNDAWGLRGVEFPFEVYHYEVGKDARRKLQIWARNKKCKIV